jgi:hypothetical protein
MTDITVYDPAMCCSTGICGPEVDQKLVTFAADLDWLKSQGINVTRINLSQEPAKFADNATVKSVLEDKGVDGLPVVLTSGEMRSAGRYPDRAELAQFAGVPFVADAAPAASSGCCGPAQEKSSGCC